MKEEEQEEAKAGFAGRQVDRKSWGWRRSKEKLERQLPDYCYYFILQFITGKVFRFSFFFRRE